MKRLMEQLEGKLAMKALNEGSGGYPIETELGDLIDYCKAIDRWMRSRVDSGLNLDASMKDVSEAIVAVIDQMDSFYNDFKGIGFKMLPFNEPSFVKSSMPSLGMRQPVDWYEAVSELLSGRAGIIEHLSAVLERFRKMNGLSAENAQSFGRVAKKLKYVFISRDEGDAPGLR